MKNPSIFLLVVWLAVPFAHAWQNPLPTTERIAKLEDLKGTNGNQEFLDPEQAFVLTVHVRDARTLLAQIKIAPGYYLYREKTGFQIARTAGVRLAAYQLPSGLVKVDQFFGKTEIYHDQLVTELRLERSTPGATDLALLVNYQGCAEKGICYPPMSKKVSLRLPPLTAGGAAEPEPNTAAFNGINPGTRGASIRTFMVAMLAAFGSGLLLTFTPCVLPMVPILSSIIVGQDNKSLTKLQAGLLSLSYVVGTAVTYTAAGVTAGATGDQLQAYFQNAWAIGILSLIFVLLALSMFGLYSLQMPGGVQSYLQKYIQTIKGGSFFGAFILGLFSALIVGACVSPLLISALSVAISSKDPVLGGAIMFAMALGMGVLLIAMGVGAGHLLPKAGPWMDIVKNIFGLLLLAVAIYLLSALPKVPVLLLWSVLLIATAVYLDLEVVPKGARPWNYFYKAAAAFLLIWGTLALIGGLAGNRDIFRPVPFNISLNTAGLPATPFQRITSLRDLENYLSHAKIAGKPVIVDFYADWCVDCVRMEKATFSDPRVRQKMSGFVLLQADVTDNTPDAKAIKQRLAVLGPPATLFFSASGKERADLRFYGFKSADEFLAVLAQV
jgi:thioredoxin:protein disulfide reductase